MVQKYMISETMIDTETLHLTLLNILMKCIKEATEEEYLFDDDEDNDDDESPIVCPFDSCQCGDDLCLYRVGMKAYFKHPHFYNLKRKCLSDAYDILTGKCCYNQLGRLCHGDCSAN